MTRFMAAAARLVRSVARALADAVKTASGPFGDGEWRSGGTARRKDD